MTVQNRRKAMPRRTVSAPVEESYVQQESPIPVQVAPAAASGRAPRARRRSWLVAFNLLWTGAVIGLSTAGVAWGAYRYALTSPRFAVREFQIEGTRRLSDSNVLAEAGLRVGQNVFAVDTAAAERRLLDDPWISAVRVTRRLPAALRVEVTEREAGAVVVLRNRLWLVTKTGEPFKELHKGDPSDLAVVTGISSVGTGRDLRTERHRLATAMEVLRHYERSALFRTYPPQEVHVTEGGDVVLTIGRSGIALHLGDGPWAKKLAMAERVLNKVRGRGRSPGIVFLDNRAHPERVVVRMR